MSQVMYTQQQHSLETIAATSGCSTNAKAIYNIVFHAACCIYGNLVGARNELHATQPCSFCSALFGLFTLLHVRLSNLGHNVDALLLLGSPPIWRDLICPSQYGFPELQQLLWKMAPVCQGDESFGQHLEFLLQSRVNAEVRCLDCRHHESMFMLALTAQVGMLVGRPGNRDTFLLLLPTPHEVCNFVWDALGSYLAALSQLFKMIQGNTAPVELQSVTDSSSKKNKKAQPDAQVQLAVDNITEHAAQVAAMLPGGC